jgi:hypothetical protein
MPPKPQVFKTPDGKEFSSRAEWRDYMMLTFYSFKNKKGSPFPAARLPGSIDGQMYDIADCEDTELVVMDHCEQVQIDQVKNSKIFIGACESSMFIRNCDNCTFYVACRQLRLREVTNCKFFCFSTAEVHIEYSKNVRFAPFNGGYAEQAAHLSKAKLPYLEHNLWYDIFDHNDPGKTRENWSLLPESEYGAPWFPGGACTPAVPLTKAGSVQRVEGDTTGDGGKPGMQSFSLKTSAQEAQATVEAAAGAVEEHTISNKQAEDIATGLSVDDCIKTFANYIPGVTNLADICTPTCEITMANGEPMELGDFKEQAGPTLLQEVEKQFQSADGSVAWASFWSSNCITNELFVTTAVMEKQDRKNGGGYKLAHVHRGAGVTV